MVKSGERWLSVILLLTSIASNGASYLICDICKAPSKPRVIGSTWVINMKKLENESVAKALENVSRHNGRFQKCVVLFCFVLNIVKKKHDQERFGFDDAENF